LLKGFQNYGGLQSAVLFPKIFSALLGTKLLIDLKKVSKVQKWFNGLDFYHAAYAEANTSSATGWWQK